MKRFFHLMVCICLISTTNSFAQKDVLEKVNQLELKGQFKEAAGTLASALQGKSLPLTESKKLEFELDRLDRIKKDFPYTKESLFEELKNSVKNLTPEEFERWINEGRFDSREIDGKQYYMTSSISNLYFRYPELSSRRTLPKETTAHQKAVWETCTAIRKAALAEKKPYVLPKRFHVTMTVTAKPTAAPAGEIIRAWLPIPRRYPFQDDFQFLSASSAARRLDDEQSPIRAVYLEQPAR